MKVPVSWLKDFVKIDDDYTVLAEKLVSCGFEVEEIIKQSDAIKNVITVEIISVEQHPNADKLKVCKVNGGSFGEMTVVTNVRTLKPGDIVPFAMNGAELANGMKIKAGELRGVHSDGMFCGFEELALAPSDYPDCDPESVIVFSEKPSVGVDINTVIGNDDIILDIGVTANRQDCNSILGIAREVAAVTGQKVKMPKLSFSENSREAKDFVSVRVDNTAVCPRYMAKVVENVKLTESTPLMKKRLKAVGLRPINNLVDVTNYVLIEIGQPMHAFDLSKLSGSKIIVRNAGNDEKIVALDGKEYSLNEKDLAICDAEKPVAVAGVMGGKFTGIEGNTDTVVFESAKFARDSVRRTSRRLNLHSDSSARFEKSIDFLSQEIGLNRCLAIMDENGWGEVVGGVIDCCVDALQEKVLNVDYHEINAIFGIDVDKKIMADILNSLNLQTELRGDMLHVVVPLYRDDIVGKNDLAEEIIRIYGYSHITPVLIADGTSVQGGRSKTQERMEMLREVLCGKGCYEIYNYSFQSPKAFDMLGLASDDKLRDGIKIANPLGEDFSVMRTNLAYAMLKTIAYNYQRGNKEGRFFEIAKTYIPKQLPITELPEEKYKLCIGIIGENEDFYSIKAVIEEVFSVFKLNAVFQRASLSYMHDGRTAEISVDGTVIGYVGEVNDLVSDAFDVDKRLYLAELDCEFILENARDYLLYKGISRFQSMERDLALVMPEERTVDEVLAVVRQFGTELLEDAYAFDVYTGNQVAKGNKSVAFKLIFRDMNKTLKEGDVSGIIDNLLKELEKIDACLR